MSPETIGLIGLAAFFSLIYLGMPVALAFLSVGVSGIIAFRGLEGALSVLAVSPFNTLSSYVWSVFPLFTFMGFLAMTAGIASSFYEGSKRLIGHLRGGLGYACVLANSAFGACVGDPLTAAVTFTGMSLPEMEKAGYSKSVAGGTIVAAGILATLIPPSGPLIVYGALTQTPIADLFIAAVIPGIILTGLYLFTLWTICLLRPNSAPPSPKFSWPERIRGIWMMWPFVFSLLTILGGIYLGVFTPTEAGAVGCFIMIITALIRGKLNKVTFLDAFYEAAQVIGSVGMMIAGATVFNSFLAFTGLPSALAKTILDVSRSPIVFGSLMILVYFILGMFLDPGSLVLLTVPLFYPVGKALGLSSLQYGVLLTLMLGIGGLTPPYGMLCISISGLFRDRISLGDLFKGAFPYIIPLLLMSFGVILFPALTHFLPSTMGNH